MNKTSAAIVRTLLLGTSCLSVFALGAQAQPTGGTVVAGQGTISNPTTTKTVIDQTTGKLVINWDSFSIGAGGTVQFVQPNSKSIALNRVMGAEPSSIYGNLLANGQVWLINGNGILFGKGSQINVGGILATTSDIRDADFLAGKYNFTGGTGASVVNQGTIRTKNGGSVVLSGASASNQGLIVANAGSVTIGGAKAFTVDFDGDGLISYAITTPTDKATNGQTGASNSGTIQAAGGRVVMTARAASSVQDAVVNNTGIISATSAKVRNGEVILDGGDGGVSVSGTIDASGRAGGATGGNVTITGGTITVADNTHIDVSGDAGGGTVKIGGDLHGAGATPHAQTVTVGKADITADAITSGNGGTVVVWSDGRTDFSGIVSARGGAHGGHGGLVETSGHTLNVADSVRIDTLAPKGATGTWLIDPDAIYIVDGDQGTLNGGNINLGDNPGGTDLIAPSTIVNALATTDVSLQAAQQIVVINDIDYDSAHTFSMLSQGDIYIVANVQNAGTGAINVIAGWDGTTTDPAHFSDPGVYGQTKGGVYLVTDYDDTTFGHAASVGSAGGTVTIAGSDIQLEAQDASVQLGFKGAGGGDIVLRSVLDLSLEGSNGNTATIGNGSAGGDVTGNVTGDIDIVAGGDLSLFFGEGGSDWIGNQTSGDGIESGDVSIVAGQVQSSASFGAANSLGAMLLADLGTTGQAGSGGDVTLAITDPQTDFINAYLNFGTMNYSSPHALTLLSTGSITLPYSIQNAGTGDLTILAGWNPDVAPADVLTTPGAYGNPTGDDNQNGGFPGASVWVVGASDINLYDNNAASSNHSYTVGDAGAGTAIGSKGGTTTVGAAQIYVEGLNGYAQIGYHGDGGNGDIHVIANGTPGDGASSGVGACFDANANICVIGGRSGFSGPEGTYAQIGDLGLGVAGTAGSNITISATGNIAVSGGGIYGSDDQGVPSYDPAVPNAYGQIGNGDASGATVQTVSGTISIQAGGDVNFASSSASGSQGWAGNRTGEGGSQSGDITLIASSINGDSGALSAMLSEDLGWSADSGGDVTLGLTGTGPHGIGGLVYDSPHAFTYLAAGDLYIAGTVENDGAGAITLVAGWDGHTLGPDLLTQPGAFGNNEATVVIGGWPADGDVFAGSKSGDITVLTDNLVVEADWGLAQLGYHGAGTGNITVQATGDVDVTGGDPFEGGSLAMIGNGGFDDSVGGPVGGNIFLSAGGTLRLSTLSEGCECGDFQAEQLVSPTAFIGNAAGIGGGPVNGNVTLLAADFDDGDDANGGFGDIIGADLVNGDVTFGETDPENDIELSDGGLFDASHDFTILSAGSIFIGGQIENSGSGNITLVAGWDGHYDPQTIGAEGTYGLNGAAVTIGGGLAGGDAGIGTASGNLTVYTGDLVLDSEWGSSQLGYRGDGGGNIKVVATGDVTLYGGDEDGQYALIGNGSLAGDVTGDVHGTIDVSAAFGSTDFYDGDGARAWLGNATSGDGKASGDVTVVTDFGGVPTDILIADLGSSADTGGDVFFGYTDPDDGAVTFGGMTYNSPHDFTIASPADLNIRNSIQNAGSGEVVLVAGWDEQTYGASAALIAAHAYGLNDSTLTIEGSDVAVGSASGLTTALGADIVVSANSGGYAQLGWHGAGGGDIQVKATGDLTVTAGPVTVDLAMIGNGSLVGDVDGPVTGDIDIHVGGQTAFEPSGDLGNVWLGNAANGAESGNVTLVTFDLADGGSLEQFLAADLAGGDFTIGVTNAELGASIGNDISYDSSHTLNLLATGSIEFDASLQNSGSGAVNIVAGWDGHTLDATHFADAGVYGNNSGGVTIGGETAGGAVSVGSAGGGIGLYADSLTLAAVNGYAQLGYHGFGGGPLNVTAIGAVTLTGGEGVSNYAQIGAGTVFGSRSSGAASIDAGSIAATGNNAIVANALSLSARTGGIGDADTSVRIESETLTVRTQGGDVFLDSPNYRISIGDAQDHGIDLSGGSLTLAAGGNIQQTGAIHVGSLHLSTTGDLGAIALMETDNSFDTVSLSTEGGGASLYDSAAMTIAGAMIGGNGSLNLTSAGAITQTGAIVSPYLSVTSTGGPITLINADNAFGTLNVSTSGSFDATVSDSVTVQVGNTTVGGKLTLSSGGGIGEGGAVTAHDLSLTANNGGISFASANNVVSGTVTLNASGAATFDNTLAIALGASSVGGVLTLVTGGTISQTGAIQAGGLDATGQTVTLNDAGNSFATLGVHASTASITDSTAVMLTFVTTGGGFTLAAGGAVGETGGISAQSVDISTTSGAITLASSTNSFATLTVATGGSDSVTVVDGTALSIASADVGGRLSLTAAALSQTGTIHTQALSVTANDGAITLTNLGNAFGSLTVLAQSDTSIVDSTAVTLGNVSSGTFTLAAGGAIGQTGFVATTALVVSTTTGAITLTNAGNSFATLDVTTHGSDSASFVDSGALSVASANVGGTLSLTGASLTQTGAIHAAALNASATSGAITLASSGNAFATLSASTSADNAASVTDSTSVSVTGADVGGLLTLVSAGGIAQSGAIHAAGLSATANGGTILLTNSGNAFATLGLATTGSNAAAVTDSTGLAFSGATVGGALTLSAGGAVTQTGALVAGSLSVATSAGAIVLDNTANNVGGLAAFSTAAGATFDNSVATTLAVTSVGGTFTLVSGGAIAQVGALNAGGLNATANAGAIVLTNAGNRIGTLSVSTTGSNDATVADSTGVSLSGGNVGGTFTLAAGGAIGQSAAFTAKGLVVSTTTGAITLANTGNSFATLDVTTHGSDNATLVDSGALGIAGATVGGVLSLTASGIGQSGAIHAAGLNVVAPSGAIVLTNSGNAFATLNVATASGNDATVTDSTGVALAGGQVGGTFTLSAGGAVTQTGAIHSAGLSVATSAGGILLTSLANAVSGTVLFNTPGAANFYNTMTTRLGASSIGGDLVLLSAGDVDVIGAVQSTAGAITVLAGWNGTTTDSAHFADSGVYGNNSGSVVIGGAGAQGNAGLGSQSGTTAVYADNVSLLGTNGGAQIGYHGTGGGGITVAALGTITLAAGNGGAVIGNGGTDVSGAVTGNIDVRAGGVVTFTDSQSSTAWIGNRSTGGEAGNLILIAQDFDTPGDRVGDIVTAEIGGGDVTLGFTGTADNGPDHDFSVNSSHTLNLLTEGNLVMAGSMQNAGTGAINLVAGWDGHTIDPAAYGHEGVAGNGGKGVIIGGASAEGAVAVGSAGGKTSVYGASLTLAAVDGYAQLGFHGHGAGAILVDVSGGVTLTGGSGTSDYAQIGNGGLGTSGNNSGDIEIDAGGDVTMTGGAGSEAYVQIGHGGAESNSGAQQGYSNSGAITLSLARLVMNAGSGGAAYVQIGQGGYKAGANLAGGTATNSGDIAVHATQTVSLLGSGVDAYAQIGNGGSQSNLNAAASAGGTDSGLVSVLASNDEGGGVTLTAGAGPNAYAQIGNGGYAINSGPSATVANFTVTGDVTVSDLALTGSGENGYSQIGNGDASHHGFGNISGDIVIDAGGNITYTNGTGPHSQANIGNFIGQGTTSGHVTGANPPPDEGGQDGGNVTTDPGTVGTIVTSTNNNPNNNQTPPITTINTVVVTTPDEGQGATGLSVHIENAPPPGPLAQLDGGKENGGANGSDGATVVIADSLDGSKKQATTQSILGGLLKQTNPTDAAHVVHPVPPADQDFSSWGNEALWQ